MKPDPFERFRELFPRTFRDEGGLTDQGRRWLPIAVSILVAIALWFTVNMRETYTVSVPSPLSVVTLPQGQALRALPAAQVRVQYQGDGWDLLKLSRTPPEIPLYADGPTVNLVSAAGESARLPTGIRVLSVQPQSVDLSLDDAITRRLPIRLAGSIDLEAGYGRLGEPELDPDTVEIRGARSLIGSLEAWPTAPLDLENLDRSISRTLPLSDTLAGLVGLSIEQTQVTLQVGQFTEGTRMLDVQVEGVPPGVSRVRLIPNRVRVTYLVPTDGDHFDRAETSPALLAVVDYADIARDTTAGSVPVSVRIPEDLTILDVRVEPRRLEYFTVRE
ncbi:MAG: YbbR-like domain-containing protein [Rhodothermaceae bacterium]|nr:YbbR-like domain-containing protein [Rhodothermaceae bacterium]